jgi:hypothetical protein
MAGEPSGLGVPFAKDEGIANLEVPIVATEVGGLVAQGCSPEFLRITFQDVNVHEEGSGGQ